MRKIEEIYWLRAYGCIAVFLFHLLDHVNQRLDNVATDLMRIPLVLGTPIFLFIAVFVFAVRYDKSVPEGFLAQRVKYVMVPYFVYGFIYSTAEWLSQQPSDESVGFVANAIEYYVYAGWHGYFLIIAMQFYVAYWLFTRWQLWRLNPVPWLWGACGISMAYWGLAYWFDVDLPGYLLWIAPLGWIYVFFLALVLVRYYPLAPESVMLTRPAWMQQMARPALLVLMVALIIAATFAGWLAFSSKEVWVIPFFVLFTLCAMRYLAGRPAPLWVRYINAYSFGIYLAHPMFFVLADLAVEPLSLPIGGYALVLMAVGVVGSVGLNKLANTTTLGAMLFGKRLKVS
ncbi:acyltransferase [Halomonas sp. QX-2]|jgi:membrane-bound acyltransferase YfiQ involved in biofilm formation|uniref:Acyltransferase n=1 Tax=Vreelandella sedimenti TaxID=2729618 RepID=A0A7Z0SLP2_9GAMM|nr:MULTISPECIES: acyltransferase [Halomonas]NYT71348.1 acyltransferase [Halomonas sedimenti]|tara:strand:- start:84527 stop:85555 length:1029 start_codon:yes stop_codon:yes gene_type:complete